MKDYVPEKIKDYYVPISFKDGDNIISEGNLRCSCSNNTFSLKYLGKIDCTLWKAHISPSDESVLILVVSCDECGKDICLFDSRTDGNDAVFSTIDKKKAPDSYPIEKLTVFACPKCKDNHFELKVKYEHPNDIERDIKDYGNTFGWIWVDLICSSCKKGFKRFLDFETG